MANIRNVPNDQLPVIGPWLGRIGQVRATMATPCTVDPAVWVLAGFSGAPKLIWSLFKPDAFDLVTERFDRPHKKKRKRRFRFGGMIDDSAYTPGKKGLRWAVFNLGKLAERVGWWFLIIDASTELAVHWTSTAYIWSGCPVPQGSSAKSAANDTLGNDPPTGGVFAGWGVVYTQPPLEATLSRIYVPAGMQASPMLKFEINKPGGGLPVATSVRIRLMDLASGQPYQQWDFDNPEVARTGSYVWMNPGLLNPAREWGIDFQTNGGYFQLKAELTVNASPVQGFEFDP